MHGEFNPGTGLGPRLRRVREERGISVRELARQIGCSPSLISQVERGLSVPSVGVLYSLATVLSCSLDYLVFGADQARDGVRAAPEVPVPVVVRADATAAVGEGRSLPWPRGSAGQVRDIVQRAAGRPIIDLASGVRWERLTPFSDNRVDFLEVVYAPGGHSTDERRPLRHEGREYGVILSGTLQANVGFESYELGPGDSIAFDSSVPHEYANRSDAPVHAIWIVAHDQSDDA